MGVRSIESFISDFEVILPEFAYVLTSGKNYVFNLKNPINKLDRHGNLKVKEGANYTVVNEKQKWMKVTDI